MEMPLMRRKPRAAGAVGVCADVEAQETPGGVKSMICERSTLAAIFSTLTRSAAPAGR